MGKILDANAALAARLNLILQIAMAGLLVFGAFLARRGRYRAHGLCQSAVMLLNLVAIALVMAPSFRPSLAHRASAIATIHGSLGILAELLGLYIVLAAGTNLLPGRLRFKRWKLWMRIELALWWLVLLLGVGTYWLWYG
jgi:uncharacterized membrane protein YozB (DUF420 family)